MARRQPQWGSMAWWLRLQTITCYGKMTRRRASNETSNNTISKTSRRPLTFNRVWEPTLLYDYLQVIMSCPNFLCIYSPPVLLTSLYSFSKLSIWRDWTNINLSNTYHFFFLSFLSISIKFKLYKFNLKASMVYECDYILLCFSQLKPKGVVYNLDEQNNNNYNFELNTKWPTKLL